MRVVIISGGSGNTALVNALIDLGHQVNVIVNAYDDGKSTGICRKITNTLGVSDIRKNHEKIYKFTHINPDENILRFYKARLNLSVGNEANEAAEFLDECNLSELKKFVYNFYNRETSKNYTYNDFSIANIVYAEMFSEIGYTATNDYFCNKFNLPEDCVLLNSYDNTILSAITSNSVILPDEGSIVDFKCDTDVIKKVNYSTIDKTLSNRTLAYLYSADVIIISTGTFWSSLYPTLEYADFYKLINNLTAKKYWFINSAKDGDSYTVTANEFIDIVDKLGLNLNNFTIVENLDAVDNLCQSNNKFDITYTHFGNVNGKNDVTLVKEYLENELR